MLIKIQQYKVNVSDNTALQNSNTESKYSTQASCKTCSNTQTASVYTTIKWCLKMQVPRQDVLVGRQEEHSSCISSYIEASNCWSLLHHASLAQAATMLSVSA
ncbi:TPA: hypothetical protein ACH3X3_011032 [Trebouxia sp. C0006]